MPKLKSSLHGMHEFFLVLINSTVYFLLAYLLIHTLLDLSSILTAKSMGFQGTVHFNHLAIFSDRHSWTSDTVKVIYGTAPLIALLLGLFLTLLYRHIQDADGPQKMLVWWGYIHCYSLAFGSIIAGALTGNGFGHTLAWMYVGESGKLILSVIALLALYSVGKMNTQPFIYLSNFCINYSQPQKRRQMCWFQLLIPYLIGTGVLVLMRTPLNNPYFNLINLSTFVLIAPILFDSRKIPEVYFDEKPKPPMLVWRSALFLATLLFTARLLSIHGIKW